MSKYLSAHKLNRKVWFQRKAPGKDTFGQESTQWNIAFWAWGSINTISGAGFVSQEFQTGGREVSRTTATIKVRKPQLNEVTADLRCVVDGVRNGSQIGGGTIYEIRVVLPDTQDERFIDIGVATGANRG